MWSLDQGLVGIGAPWERGSVPLIGGGYNSAGTPNDLEYASLSFSFPHQ